MIFFFTYYISYPQGPGFSLNYFQTVKSSALLCTSWAKTTKLDCSWSFRPSWELSPECHFGTRSGLLCVINPVCLVSQTVPLPPCQRSWIPKLKGKRNVTTKVLIFGPSQLFEGLYFLCVLLDSSHEHFPHGKLLTCCVPRFSSQLPSQSILFFWLRKHKI